jgi:hypothetical protein
MMFLEDERAERNYKTYRDLHKKAGSFPFSMKIQDHLDDLCNYLTIIDKIKKNLPNKLKLPDIKNDILSAKDLGFKTPELLSLETKVDYMIQWYNSYENLVNTNQDLEITDYFRDLELEIKKHMFDEELLRKLQNDHSLMNDLIDSSYGKYILDVSDDLELWKKNNSEVKDLLEMIEHMKKAYKLKVYNEKFQENFYVVKQALNWVVKSFNLIKVFDPGFNLTLFSEEKFRELKFYVDRRTQIRDSDDYSLLERLLNEANFLLENSSLMAKLRELKSKSDQWKEEISEVANFFFLLLMCNAIICFHISIIVKTNNFFNPPDNQLKF